MRIRANFAKVETGEIILYQSDDKSTQLEVLIDEDTVCLTQAQMVELFTSTKQNLSLHINNIFKKCELSPHSTIKEYLTFHFEGSRRLLLVRYNLKPRCPKRCPKRCPN